jgi:hypothetical protein
MLEKAVFSNPEYQSPGDDLGLATYLFFPGAISLDKLLLIKNVDGNQCSIYTWKMALSMIYLGILEMSSNLEHVPSSRRLHLSSIK